MPPTTISSKHLRKHITPVFNVDNLLSLSPCCGDPNTSTFHTICSVLCKTMKHHPLLRPPSSHFHCVYIVRVSIYIYILCKTLHRTWGTQSPCSNNNAKAKTLPAAPQLSCLMLSLAICRNPTLCGQAKCVFVAWAETPAFYLFLSLYIYLCHSTRVKSEHVNAYFGIEREFKRRNLAFDLT